MLLSQDPQALANLKAELQYEVADHNATRSINEELKKRLAAIEAALDANAWNIQQGLLHFT